MNNIQHSKTKQKSFVDWTIKHVQTVPIQARDKERADIAKKTKDWLKTKGNKIKKIKDGVTGFTDMTRREVSAKKGKQLEEILSEHIHCKGCTEDQGKPETHPKRDFGRSDTNRGFVLSCRAHKLAKAKEAALKLRLDK